MAAKTPGKRRPVAAGKVSESPDRVRPAAGPAGSPGAAEFSAAEREEARAIILRGLQEDLSGGDITSEVLIPQEVSARAEFVPREDGILCGIPVVAALFREIEPAAALRPLRSDGDRIRRGEPFLDITGPAQVILRGERLALNFLQRLSGIATATRRLADCIAGTGCSLYDTRKTTPGWRALEKYAVRAGGGRNHRRSLSELALVKDNHRLILGSLGAGGSAEWVKRIREARPGTIVEVEVDSLEEFRGALAAGPEIILLDNFSVDDLRRAVEAARAGPGKRPLLEASGGIRLENARDIAETGVDRIAVGWITHSAPALDIGLDRVEVLK